MSENEVRHLQPAKSFSERVFRMRYTIARRALQILVLTLFIGTARWGWTVFGKPLLAGDLSSSNIGGFIALADPFAALQRFAAQYWLSEESVIGALIVLVLYTFLSGRTFCAWICPMNIVTDAAAWCREKLGIRSEVLHLPSWFRYVMMVLSLIVSTISGVAAFEAVSPQAVIWREAVYGVGLGFISAVCGIFAFDLAVSKRGWCGHICPLGAFWASVGTVGLVKVGYEADSCTRCGDCLKVCPEPQVLNYRQAQERGMVVSGECTNCGRCISVCPEKSLKFILRCRAKRQE